MFAAKPVDYSFVFTQTRLGLNTERMTDSSSSSLLVRKPLCFLPGSPVSPHHTRHAMPRPGGGGGTDIGQSIIKTNAINLKQEQK